MNVLVPCPKDAWTTSLPGLILEEVSFDRRSEKDKIFGSGTSPCRNFKTAKVFESEAMLANGRLSRTFIKGISCRPDRLRGKPGAG
jgi:hypothetical protein